MRSDFWMNDRNAQSYHSFFPLTDDCCILSFRLLLINKQEGWLQWINIDRGYYRLMFDLFVSEKLHLHCVDFCTDPEFLQNSSRKSRNRMTTNNFCPKRNSFVCVFCWTMQKTRATFSDGWKESKLAGNNIVDQTRYLNSCFKTIRVDGNRESKRNQIFSAFSFLDGKLIDCQQGRSVDRFPSKKRFESRKWRWKQLMKIYSNEFLGSKIAEQILRAHFSFSDEKFEFCHRQKLFLFWSKSEKNRRSVTKKLFKEEKINKQNERKEKSLLRMRSKDDLDYLTNEEQSNLKINSDRFNLFFLVWSKFKVLLFLQDRIEKRRTTITLLKTLLKSQGSNFDCCKHRCRRISKDKSVEHRHVRIDRWKIHLLQTGRDLSRRWTRP